MNFEDLLKINNEKLNKILNYVTDEAIFFKENLRLISKSEIENFEKDYQCKLDGIVSLKDTFDKVVLV